MFLHICSRDEITIGPAPDVSVGFSQQRAAAQGRAAMCAGIEPAVREQREVESQMDYTPLVSVRRPADSCVRSAASQSIYHCFLGDKNVLNGLRCHRTLRKTAYHNIKDLGLTCVNVFCF